MEQHFFIYFIFTIIYIYFFFNFIFLRFLKYIVLTSWALY